MSAWDAWVVFAILIVILAATFTAEWRNPPRGRWRDDWMAVAEATREPRQPAVERVGRHRTIYGSLDDQPAPVIAAAVTDVPYKWRRP